MRFHFNDHSRPSNMTGLFVNLILVLAVVSDAKYAGDGFASLQETLQTLYR